MNLTKSILIFLIFIFFQSSGISQPTVGVISLEEDIFDGYTFFSPFSGTKAYMIDNCGRLVNSWDRGTRPGLAAYFLEDGTMLRTYKPSTVGPFTSASNSGGIEIVDWQNNTLWQYELNTSTQITHHDVIKLPNGNVLALSWELTYRDELIELGRDPNQIAPQNYMWSEKILELKPIGDSDAEIVWEWHINDHYIQDFDSTKAGFGIVADHPELFDINLPELDSGNSNASRDWNHFNAIDYNEDLDQILVSVRNSDEVWIIDHSTTIEEAASHEGGNSGKGGDILYRWGNASAYDRAPISDQKLFGQHGVHWIKNDLENEGKILIFNNGNGIPNGSYSRVQIIDPEIVNGQYLLNSSMSFGPSEATTIYGEEVSERFYSPFLSNVQQLPNENFLINSGSPGRIFEINSENEVVWEYIIPLFGDTPANQGQNVSNNANFRAYKFGADFIGFEGIDLTPGAPIELNPEDCILSTSTNQTKPSTASISYNPLINTLELKNINPSQVSLFDRMGRKVFQTYTTDNQVELPILKTGLYFVYASDNQFAYSSTIFIR